MCARPRKSSPRMPSQMYCYHDSLEIRFIVKTFLRQNLASDLTVTYENLSKTVLNSKKITNFNGLHLRYLLLKLPFWAYFCNLHSTAFTRIQFSFLTPAEKKLLFPSQALSQNEHSNGMIKPRAGFLTIKRISSEPRNVLLYIKLSRILAKRVDSRALYHLSPDLFRLLRKHHN